jgi:regulator of cell morphogenesis and NO signaling
MTIPGEFMPSFTTATTVGQFVVDRPGRARVFQRLGIDFCCGGKLTLAQACQRKGLDPDAALTALVEEPDSRASDPVEAMSLTELCDHIERTHHANLRVELPRLGAMLRKVAGVHGLHHPWLRDMLVVFDDFDRDLREHMLKEEHLLFPLIRRIDAGDAAAILSTLSIASPIAVMEQEHEQAGDALAQLRALSNDFIAPVGACATFLALLDGLRELESDMHWHVHKENNVLFPRALAV